MAQEAAQIEAQDTPRALLEWAWRQAVPTAQAYALEVLAALSTGPRRPGPLGVCQVDRPWLAARCRMGKSTMDRALKGLLAIGLITEWAIPRQGSVWRMNPEVEAVAAPRRKQSVRGAARGAAHGAAMSNPPKLGALPSQIGSQTIHPKLGAVPSQIGSRPLPIREPCPPKLGATPSQNGVTIGGSKKGPSSIAVEEGGTTAPPDGNTAGFSRQARQLPSSERQGERRTAPRGGAVVEIPCRGYDRHGTVEAQRYAVTPEQLAMLKDLHPELDGSPEANQFTGHREGVRQTLKVMAVKYGAKRDPRELRTRADMPRRIQTWLDEETHKLLRRAQQPKLPGNPAIIAKAAKEA